MTAHLNIADVWKDIATAHVNVGGSWKDVVGIWVKIDGVWKLTFGTGTPASTLDATMQNAIVSGSRVGAGDCTSNAAVLLPTGGTAPYTYAWTKVSGDTLTVTSPTAASSTFSAALTSGQTKSAVYRCTVTDALLDTASATVTINLVSSAPPAINVSISPSNSTVFRTNGTGGSSSNVTSGTYTATITGGSGNFTIDWNGGGSSVNGDGTVSVTFTYLVGDNTDTNVSVGVTVYDDSYPGSQGQAFANVRYISAA